MKNKFAVFTLATTLLTATFCVQAEITVSDAWIRGVVEDQDSTAAYLNVKSTQATKLVKVASPVADSLQIHEMSMHGEVMTMRPVKSLTIPANKVIELKPGGFHIMLNGLKKPLVKGDTVPIQLTFIGKNGVKSTVDAQAQVKDLSE